MKGNEEFIEETEFYGRYESIDTSAAVPIDVLPEKHLVFPKLLNVYGEEGFKIQIGVRQQLSALFRYLNIGRHRRFETLLGCL